MVLKMEDRAVLEIQKNTKAVIEALVQVGENTASHFCRILSNFVFFSDMQQF